MPKPIALALLLGLASQATAADLACNGLVPSGSSMICSGFEPNWAVELSCDGGKMRSTFIDAFSGDSIRSEPGTVTFSGVNPWTFETSHPVKGTIAYTPAGCTDESDAKHDFTFTPTAAPGLNGPFYPFCCRMR
jgi:hypothetical protein